MSFKAAIGFPIRAPTAEDELRRLRVQAARENRHWYEVEESALVPRPPNFLVHADSDAAYTRSRAQVFTTGAAKPQFNETLPLAFFVTADDGLVFLERHRQSWSEILGQRARRGR